MQMRPNIRLSMLWTYIVVALTIGGCNRAPSPMEFEKPVFDVHALVDTTYEGAVKQLGEPEVKNQSNAARGNIIMASWANKERTLSLTTSYDVSTMLPYVFLLDIKPGNYSTPEQLRKAVNVAENDSRYKVQLSEDRDNKLRKQLGDEVVPYRGLIIKVTGRETTEMEKEWLKKNMPQLTPNGPQ